MFHKPLKMALLAGASVIVLTSGAAQAESNGDQIQEIVVPVKVKKIVSEINDDIPVLGEHLNRLFSNRGRLLVFAVEAQIPFFFT